MQIPFWVGDNRSRTWIFTLTEKGLLFKHDHRHKDGSPDDITYYGGYSDGFGTEYEQSFPADGYTQNLIPAAETNVWRVSLDLTQHQLTYYLTRHNKPRFKAILTNHSSEVHTGKEPVRK